MRLRIRGLTLGIVAAASLVLAGQAAAQSVDVKILKPTQAGGSSVSITSGDAVLAKTEATPFGDFSFALTLMPGQYSLKVSRGKAMEEAVINVKISDDGVTEIRGRLTVEPLKKGGKLKLSGIRLESTPSDRVSVVPAEPPPPAPATPAPALAQPEPKQKSETKP